MVAFVKLEEVAMHPLGVAYLDVVFALTQLFGGVLVGLYLKQKIGVKKTLILGLAASVIFSFIAANTASASILFITYALNGLGYGLTYNVLLGLALQPFEKSVREVSMGIYQTFFAVGIFYGDKIYALVIKALPETLTTFEIYHTVFLGIAVLGAVIVAFISLYFKGINQSFLEA